LEMDWPFCTEGPVPPDSPVYVQREADHRLRQHLLEMHCTLLAAPRQMGKTSLIRRLQVGGRLALPPLAESDYTIAYVDVQNLGRNEAEWCQSLHSCLSASLDIKPLLIDNLRFRSLLQSLAEHAEEGARRIAIALDGIGDVEALPPDFLQALRRFLVAREAEPRLRNLTLILAGEFEPRRWIPSAKVVTLKDFYRPQVHQLVDFLEVKGKLAEAIANCIYHWTGGHPYLTQKMCSALAEGHLPLTIEGADQAAERIWKEDVVHLPYILGKLDVAPRAKEQLTRIMASEKVHFDPASELALTGVVKSNKHGNCAVRNRIYEKALKEHLWPKAT